MIVYTGPIEYFLIAFGSDTISDNVINELDELAKAGIVRILDLIFLRKTADGDVSVLELDEVEDITAFAEIDGAYGALVGDEDIDFVGSQIDPGSSAALVVVEDLWAASLAAAIEGSGGTLLAGARIPRDLADVALAALIAD